MTYDKGMSPTDRAVWYADNVLAGNIPVCRYVKLACARFRDDLKKSRRKAYSFRFDAARADIALSLIHI